MKELSEAAGRNPIAAALIGMGVFWLAGRTFEQWSEALRGGDRLPDAAGLRSAVKTGWDSTRKRLSDVTDEAGRQVRALGDTVGETIESTTRGIREAGTAAYEQGSSLTPGSGDLSESTKEFASDSWNRARSNIEGLFREQPLMLGAVGLAIGAGIAASLPSTEVEAEYLGETSDELKAKTQAFASEQAQHAKARVEAAATAAMEEARHQGLTPGSFTSAGADASR